MGIEVQLLETKKTKLTLTPTRTTVKFPLNTSEDYKTSILDFTKRIQNEFGPIVKSFRGQFRENGIMLQSDNSKEKHYFELNKKNND